MWAKKLIKLDNIKNLDLKKGNRDRVVSKSSDSSLVKKEREQVKIKRYAGMDGNFLSHAHYRDPKRSLFPFFKSKIFNII